MKIKELLDSVECSLDINASIGGVFEQVTKNKKGAVVLTEGGKPAGIVTERDVLHLFKKKVPLEYKAADYSSKRLIVAKEDRDLDFCMNLMLDHSIRRLVVVDEERRFKGVVTQDMMLPYFEKKGLSQTIFARDLIDGITVIAAQKSFTLEDALNLMGSKNISILPIVEDESPIGVITESDVSRFAKEKISLDTPITSLMTKPVITISKDETLHSVVQFMNEKKIRHIVVTDADGKVSGVITNRDIIRSLKGDYNSFLEEKIGHVKKSLDLLSQVVLEITCFENETAIQWGNAKAYEVFGERLIDFPIEAVLPFSIWREISTSLKESRFIKKKGTAISGRVYDITCAKSGKRNVQIILNDVTNISEISKKYKDIQMEKDGIKNNLQESEKRYRRIVELAKEGFVYFDCNGKILDINTSLAQMVGYYIDELIGKDVTLIFKEGYAFGFWRRDFSKKFISSETVLIHKNGAEIPAFINANYISEDGRGDGVFAFVNDIIELKELQKKITIEQEYTKNILDLMKTPILIVKNNKGHRANRALLELSGMADIEEFNARYTVVCDFLSCHLDGCKRYGTTECFEEASNANSQDSDSKVKIFDFRYGSERVFYTKSTKIGESEYIVTFNDVTDLHNEKEHYEDIASFDSLTKVYTRARFNTIARNIMANCKNEGEGVALIVFDIDHFKSINDNFGHGIGDIALAEVAKRAKQTIRNSDMIGRWGGEEFVILLRDMDIDSAFKKAEKIRNFVSSIDITKEVGKVTCSFGVAECGDGDTLESLFEKADEAMYRAKKEGRNRTKISEVN